MLVYRIIPEVKREFLYYEDESTNSFSPLEPEGHGGYPAGYLLNRLFGIDTDEMVERHCSRVSDEVVSIENSCFCRMDSFFKKVISKIDFARVDSYVDDHELQDVYDGEWKKEKLKRDYRHLLFNYRSFNLLGSAFVEDKKPLDNATEGFLRYSLEKMKKMKSYSFASYLEGEDDFQRLLQSAFYSFQEGLCTMAEAESKLGFTEDDLNDLRESSFQTVSRLSGDKLHMVEAGKDFAKLFREVLQQHKPILDPPEVFHCFEELLDSYWVPAGEAHKNSSLCLLNSVAEDWSYEMRSEALVDLQKRKERSLAEGTGTYEFFHTMFQDPQMFLSFKSQHLSLEAQELLQKVMQLHSWDIGGYSDNAVSEVLQWKEVESEDGSCDDLFDFERYLSRSILVALKADLRNTMFKVDDVFDLFVVACYGANLSKVKPRECKLCHKMFIAMPGESTPQYCENYNEDRGKTCRAVSDDREVIPGKVDPGNRKTDIKRKGDRAKRNETKQYFWELSRFVEKMGQTYRYDKRISAEVYSEWLSSIGTLYARPFEKEFSECPEKAPHHLIWRGIVEDNTEHFRQQLEAPEDNIPGLSDWNGSVAVPADLAAKMHRLAAMLVKEGTYADRVKGVGSGEDNSRSL